METKKTHWKSAFKSDYLSSSDIDDRKLNLTISYVRLEECKTESGKKMCNVAHFKESNVKPMILNVTNSKMVKKFSGNKTHLEDWKDIPVTIYVDSNVRFGSDTVEGLRIMSQQPKTQKQKADLSDDKISDAINFLKSGKTIDDLKSYYSINPNVESKLKQAADEAGLQV